MLTDSETLESPGQAARQVVSVAEANAYIKQVLEGDVLLRNLWIEGEVSNFKDYGSGGQLYFTLKDSESQINCVVFANYRNQIPHDLADGQKITARASVGVYHKRGYYNLQVYYAESAGTGALAQAFERLKKKLHAEGLFDSERKKTLPQFPRVIGVLAAPQGAAVRDIVQIAQRRDATVQIYVIPSQVQGEGAVDSICDGILLANQCARLEVLVLARGGGSLEDLWAFNEEAVARAIAASTIPVVSAIGHEVDFTIADFVADLRAPTPSAAAELAIPERAQLSLQLDEYHERFQNRLKNLLVLGHEKLKGIESRLRAFSPRQALIHMQERVRHIEQRCQQALRQNLQQKNQRLVQLAKTFELLNPLQILNRGFSITRLAASGKIICRASDVHAGQEIETLLADGHLTSKVL